MVVEVRLKGERVRKVVKWKWGRGERERSWGFEEEG